MKLNILKEQAIKILKDRLSEIEQFDFNPKAWKDRTENDLREIFPIGSMQWYQISNIQFETYVTTEKLKFFNEGKDTARKLINSYIEFIEEYSIVEEQKQNFKEKDYEQKFSELLKDWNDLVPGYNVMLKKYDVQLATNETLLENIESKNQEIELIKSETIQLDNVSLNKLLKVFFNLSLFQIITTITVFIGVIIASFSIGKLYQENVGNNQLFEYKTENNNLNNEIVKLKNKFVERENKTTLKQSKK